MSIRSRDTGVYHQLCVVIPGITVGWLLLMNAMGKKLISMNGKMMSAEVEEVGKAKGEAKARAKARAEEGEVTVMMMTKIEEIEKAKAEEVTEMMMMADEKMLIKINNEVNDGKSIYKS